MLRSLRGKLDVENQDRENGGSCWWGAGRGLAGCRPFGRREDPARHPLSLERLCGDSAGPQVASGVRLPGESRPGCPGRRAGPGERGRGPRWGFAGRSCACI